MSPKYRYLINAFIVLNISAVLLGSSHIVTPSPLARTIFLPYLRWTRMLQGWLLFVPEPRHEARRYRVEIVYADGSRDTWSTPSPPNWNFFERHEAYGFQKFDLASNYLEQFESVRRDYCAFVLRKFLRSSNPPVQVRLLRDQAPWPQPTMAVPLVYDESALQWTETLVGAFDVKGEILQ